MSKWAVITLMLCVCEVLRAQQYRPDFTKAVLHNTVRIQAKMTNCDSTGTGFIYYFKNPSPLKTNGGFPAIITCWHVVEGSVSGRFFLPLKQTTNGVTAGLDRLRIEFNGASDWYRDPNTNIDLAMYPLGRLLNVAQANQVEFTVISASYDMVPRGDQWTNIGAFQEVKFVGYPIGLWDEKNNLPIVRRGITATDASVDYNGSPKFLVDGAVFPGSSGSPVYVGGDLVSRRPSGGLLFDAEPTQLLGVLAEMWSYNVEGNGQVVTIPTAFDAKTRVPVPANLGVVIKSTCLDDFQGIVDSLIITGHSTNVGK